MLCYLGSRSYQGEEIYQCCIRPVLFYCCKTWQLAVPDVARLRGLERFMIRGICGVRMVHRVSTDVLWDRVDLTVMIEDPIMQSCLQWYGCVIH